MIDEGLMIVGVALLVDRDYGGFEDERIFREVKARVQQTQSFEFDRNLCTPQLYEAGCDALESGLFPLPASSFYFQWKEKVDGGARALEIGVVGYRERGEVFVALVNRTDDGGLGWQAIIMFEEKGAFEPTILRDNREDGHSDAYIESRTAVLQRVIAFTMALRCRDVVVHDCGPSPSVKRKREKRGLPPIFEFKRVTIKPELRGIYEAASQNFERNGPRLHFRRGHIRNLPQGRQTYVSPCWVGNASLGVVDKQYEVKQ